MMQLSLQIDLPDQLAIWKPELVQLKLNLLFSAQLAIFSIEEHFFGVFPLDHLHIDVFSIFLYVFKLWNMILDLAIVLVFLCL